jgi:2-amino-4-hydroxy-6-hydroxymethyldihydropteridine diphosphokinase
MTRTSSRIRTPALIGVGSNLGDRLAALRLARRRIAALPETAIAAASPVFETEPVGGPPQGRYLNACLAVETALEPAALLDALLAIEREAGRTRSGRDAPRTLDLDLLLFGEQVIADDRLAVPHPRFALRAFALVPAAAVAPSWRVPPGADTVGQLAARAGLAGVRRCGAPEDWA